MSNAGSDQAARRSRCWRLRRFADLERHLGYDEVALELEKRVKACTKTSRCAAPGVCGARTGSAAASLRLRPTRDEVGCAASALVAETETDPWGNCIARVPRTLSPRAVGGMAALLLHWQQVRESGLLKLSQLDGVAFVKAGLLGSLHIVDVADADPRGFRYLLSGELLLDLPEFLAEGQPLSSHPIPIVAAALCRDYASARRCAAPRHDSVRACVSDRIYVYDRLILPASVSGDRVDRLLVVIDGLERQRFPEVADGAAPGRFVALWEAHRHLIACTPHLRGHERDAGGNTRPHDRILGVRDGHAQIERRADRVDAQTEIAVVPRRPDAPAVADPDDA